MLEMSRDCHERSSQRQPLQTAADQHNTCWFFLLLRYYYYSYYNYLPTYLPAY